VGVRSLDGGSSASSDPDDPLSHLDLESFADSPVGGPPAEAQDIQELLAGLSLLRLSMSAELSAAAGALEDQRPDVAADLVGGARIDLEKLRASVARERARELAPAMVGAGPEAQPLADSPAESDDAAPVERVVLPARRGVSLANWQGRILAGALALGLALTVLPHDGSGGSPAKQGAAEAQQQFADIKLVSSEFSTLRETLQSKSPAVAGVLAAGRNWNTAVARSLPDASTNATTATQIVELLREERTLLAAPALSTPELREATLQLSSSADSLFARLRALASSQVLAVLPVVLTALPLPTTPTPATATEAPDAKIVPPPASTPTPAEKGTPVSPANPQPSFVAPIAPNPSLPIPLRSLPALPRIMAHLRVLTASQETTSSTNQSSGADSLSTSVHGALKAVGFDS
jgi:hypothetical protein